MKENKKYFDTLGVITETIVKEKVVATSSVGNVSGKEISEAAHEALVAEAEAQEAQRLEKVRKERNENGASAESIRDAGLQVFADEAKALGFSDEAIAAVTGKRGRAKK